MRKDLSCAMLFTKKQDEKDMSLTNLNGVDYSPERFPITQRHVDTHFGIATQLRAPNGREVVEAIAGAYRKVFANIDKLEIKA